LKLLDKVAIVTGAASGMGKEIALLFSSQGAKVVLADINFEGAQAIEKEIKENGFEAVALKVDISKLEDVEKMLSATVDEYGTLDILVNNAGIMDNFEPVGDVTDEVWDRVFSINTKGVMMATRKAVRIFLEKESGIIINIASTGGFSGAHSGVAYGASKHAVIGITKNTAFMYAEKGIRCNAIAPGAVDTNISQSMTSMNEFGMSRATQAHQLSPRTGSPKEIANVALFLASEDASFVNGAVIVADGGWTAAF
jgi:NAD(P)-dependent dehydrogenase (short-subunit alcohol dehydrogenase family)